MKQKREMCNENLILDWVYEVLEFMNLGFGMFKELRKEWGEGNRSESPFKGVRSACMIVSIFIFHPFPAWLFLFLFSFLVTWHFEFSNHLP